MNPLTYARTFLFWFAFGVFLSVAVDGSTNHHKKATPGVRSEAVRGVASESDHNKIKVSNGDSLY